MIVSTPLLKPVLIASSSGPYKVHFFGRDDYRDKLHSSISAHIEIAARSILGLGSDHPMTLEIVASLRVCLDEQLGWSLRDFPPALQSRVNDCLKLF